MLVGLVNGDIIVYDSSLTPAQKTGQDTKALTLILSISCRNRRGKFASGRKVTGIEFLNSNVAMVTTNDSRIRFLDIRDGKVIFKIKGHKNETLPLRGSLSEDLAHVICGSEDGDVYLWSQIQSTVLAMSKKGVFGKLLTSDKSDVCEYFTP